MFDVMSNMKLHLAAADCFEKAGLRANLDGSNESIIEKEAGEFWREMDMTTTIINIVKGVEEECRSGRLLWNQAAVKGLITPYPAHKRHDDVLANHGDYWRKYEEDEKMYVEDGDDSYDPCPSDSEAGED